MLVVDDGTECTKWLELNESIAIKLQLSSDASRQVARRRSSSFIGVLRGSQRRKLSWLDVSTDQWTSLLSPSATRHSVPSLLIYCKVVVSTHGSDSVMYQPAAHSQVPPLLNNKYGNYQLAYFALHSIIVPCCWNDITYLFALFLQTMKG